MDIRVVELSNGMYTVYRDDRPIADECSKPRAEEIAAYLEFAREAKSLDAEHS